MDPRSLLEVELTDAERGLLQAGLAEWGGPALCTEELALAMGFSSVANLLEESGRLASALQARTQLSRLDWLRVLLATEVVFVSDVFGSGVEWATTTGFTDEESLRILRGIQRRLIGDVRSLIGDGVGTLRSGSSKGSQRDRQR